MSPPEFDWDPEKNARNIEQHGIDFEDAKGIFNELVVASIRPEREKIGMSRWASCTISPSRWCIAIVAENDG